MKMVFTTSTRLKYIMYSSPSLDNFIYKLSYRWTVMLLVVFSFVVTCRLMFGYSFHCRGGHSLPQIYVNMKCYTSTTYIFPEKFNMTEEGTLSSSDRRSLRRKYQTYYPWVHLFFLVQAFVFYLPHLLWKSYERGSMYRLTARVQKIFDNEEKRSSELCSLAKYVLHTQGKHKMYTYLYILFEAFNFSIALGQIVWMINFFDVTGETFASGASSVLITRPKSGHAVLEKDMLSSNFHRVSSVGDVKHTWSDFRKLHFPPAGFCEFKVPAPSGDMQLYTLMCEMPMSGLYMKMFLFLHAWYILLIVMAGIVLIYRIALFVPSFRAFATESFTCLCEKSTLKSLCYRMSYADWFFMTRMQKTMTDVDFAQMIDKIAAVYQETYKQKDENGRLSLIDDGMKDFDSEV